MTQDEPVPPLSILLGYGPAMLQLALGLGAWVVPPPWPAAALLAAQLWGGAILIFLSGVRRGLSFFTPGGPRPEQVATSLALFALGLIGLILPLRLGLPCLIVGYLAVAVLDPRAAPQGEVPSYFARLRPPQMAIFVLGLLGALARVLLV